MDVNYENEDDEFGEDGFKDTGVEEHTDVAHHGPQWIYSPPILFLLAQHHNILHSLNDLLNLVPIPVHHALNVHSQLHLHPHSQSHPPTNTPVHPNSN